MKNAYIISAKYLPGNGVDPFHFSAAGYRELGRRYAAKMLEMLKEQDNQNSSSMIEVEIEKIENRTMNAYDLLGRRYSSYKDGLFYIIH